jgi:alkyl hydroperoxide reductase subunit AhpC
LSERYDEITAAGGRIAVISVDSPGQNSAMVEKLRLPFPLLSDPDRTRAIEPFGVADPKDPRLIARPSIFVVSPEAELVYGETSRDYADRASEDVAIEALSALGLPPTTREEVEPGMPEPGPKAMPLRAMEPYFRGAKFAVNAMKMRHAAIADDASVFIAQMDRYIELVRHLRGKS